VNGYKREHTPEKQHASAQARGLAVASSPSSLLRFQRFSISSIYGLRGVLRAGMGKCPCWDGQCRHPPSHARGVHEVHAGGTSRVFNWFLKMFLWLRDTAVRTRVGQRKRLRHPLSKTPRRSCTGFLQPIVLGVGVLTTVLSVPRIH
jgi:hypothetical protein